MAKSVCIIGAGPAGIVAAKTLVHDYPKETFNVSVFEQSDRVGGLWPVSTSDAGLVNPMMHTNLSKHTVSFGDLAWPESAPTFPKAWQVGQYLKRYIEKYKGINVRVSCKVLRAVRVQNLSGVEKRWKVEVLCNTFGKEGLLHETFENLSNKGHIEVHHFDHLIVASGFFGKPKAPTALTDQASSAIPVKHSSQFRDIKQLIRPSKSLTEVQGGKILVVGGSMSGAEVAASIASQLSSEVHSPETSSCGDVKNYTVHHVMRRPFWVFPCYLPVKPLIESEEGLVKIHNPSSTFLPIDLALYDLSRRPPGPLKNKSGRISIEAAQIANASFQNLLGTDQSDLGLGINQEICNEAPWMAISDRYAEFLRSGQITTSTGRLKSSPPASSNSVTITTSDGDKVIDDVAAIVLATGFESSDSLNFLSGDLLETLGHDSKCGPFPLALNIHSTVHSSVPDLGFVGFYRGPYWGVMAMQARFLGNLWTGDERAVKTLAEDISPIPDLRKCYYESPEQLQQFPMGDYVFLMESFRDILGLERAGHAGTGQVLPARYMSASSEDEKRAESIKALSSVGHTLNASADNQKFVARAIFTAMQGVWKLDRSLKSSISTYPSGTFKGTANFYPRSPGETFDLEYLYVEEGDFETENGMKFRANRRYSHRYSESTDTLSVWFVKSDNKTVDYLFHEFEILPSTGGSGWRAKAHHLCIADTYDVVYEFCFKGVRLQKWTMAYSVKGPSKDYRIESTYYR